VFACENETRRPLELLNREQPQRVPHDHSSSSAKAGLRLLQSAVEKEKCDDSEIGLGLPATGWEPEKIHDQPVRAAAIGQLATWATRAGVDLVRGPEGGDPASIVFDAVKQATDTGIDALIVDTAGRLQNKKELMEELSKIRRVLGRLNPEAPHDVVLVLDATNGQNALSQIDVFKEVAGVTGLIMTKLDGTARGGVLVAAAEQYGLPIHAIGVGEKMEDLRPFDPDLVARVIAGVA
jgi:signal recognition particle GTPase